MTEKQSSPVGVGVLTILTVLLTLALAVFSVLTYTSAKADLALSKRNAETVTAYYTADQEGIRQKAAFLKGGEPEHEATIPMTQAQSLYIHLRRENDGSCTVLAWKTISNNDGTTIEDTLPVWDGTLPGAE